MPVVNPCLKYGNFLIWSNTAVTWNHCCLAPCKSVTNYGPLTEPISYYVEIVRTQISTSNGQTKKGTGDPLAPKFYSFRGLSSPLSWKWPSVTLSPSFGLFQSEKPLFRGVPGWSQLVSLVRICPRVLFPCRKKKISYLESGRWDIFWQKKAVGSSLEHPKKNGFSDWKRPKDGERVALGHFHERDGESPRSYENFGTSGSKKSRFVSEIRSFKVGNAVRPNFTM